MIEKIKKQLLKNEQNLSKYASKEKDAIRYEKINNDIRPSYLRDIDRIIYSKSYLRYMDKTQVFTNIENDHISRRMSHVQMVSKIARTIGRALNLNEDLIEAIALGHDLGHVPFGHLGESFLNEISLENNEGIFMHNVQSVRNLTTIENNGKGLNLTVQVLDGILCHNGEILEKEYKPVKKTKEQVKKEYLDCYKDKKNIQKLRPMTLEGCVVRISDIISYIGKDLEEAIMLGLVEQKEIPENIREILGNKNSDIITTLVIDIIKNSIDKPYITMSYEINKALDELKTFNYENIYYKCITKEQKEKYKNMFKTVFKENLKYLKNKEKNKNIYIEYLKNMDKKYIETTTDERKVIDYIAGMTDNYFIKEYNKIIDIKNN